MLKQNSKKHANQECVTCIQALMVHVFSNHFFLIYGIHVLQFFSWINGIKILSTGSLKMKTEINIKFLK